MNARLTITATCLVLIGVAGYSGYRLGASHTMPATSATQGDRKILYWHDPMVPGQRFDKPGKSPFMDMPLVPVYADGDDAGNGVNKGGVSIDSRVAQNLGIRTAEVQSAHMGAVVKAPGNVAIDERSIELELWWIYAPMPLGFFLVAVEFIRYLIGLDDMYGSRTDVKEGM